MYAKAIIDAPVNVKKSAIARLKRTILNGSLIFFSRIRTANSITFKIIPMDDAAAKKLAVDMSQEIALHGTVSNVIRC